MTFFQKANHKSFTVQPVDLHFSDQPTQKLIKSALAGDFDAARLAVADGADPNALGTVRQGGDFSFSPLHYALACDNIEAIKILGVLGADPERRAQNMGMPFLFAIILNNSYLLERLFEIKRIDKTTSQTKQHLLFESARREAPDCLKLLVELGVPIDIKDAAGYTLLMRSIEMNMLDLTLWLLERRASLDVVALSGVTPTFSIEYELSVATTKGSPKEALVHRVIMRMKELGARFPALTPEQELARR